MDACRFNGIFVHACDVAAAAVVGVKCVNLKQPGQLHGTGFCVLYIEIVYLYIYNICMPHSPHKTYLSRVAQRFAGVYTLNQA